MCVEFEEAVLSKSSLKRKAYYVVNTYNVIPIGIWIELNICDVHLMPFSFNIISYSICSMTSLYRCNYHIAFVIFRFSNVKKCSNEGRALMQLDYQQLLMKLEKITTVRFDISYSYFILLFSLLSYSKANIFCNIVAKSLLITSQMLMSSLLPLFFLIDFHMT